MSGFHSSGFVMIAKMDIFGILKIDNVGNRKFKTVTLFQKWIINAKDVCKIISFQKMGFVRLSQQRISFLIVYLWNLQICVKFVILDFIWILKRKNAKNEAGMLIVKLRSTHKNLNVQFVSQVLFLMFLVNVQRLLERIVLITDVSQWFLALINVWFVVLIIIWIRKKSVLQM